MQLLFTFAVAIFILLYTTLLYILH